MRSSHPTAVSSHNDEGTGLGVIAGTGEVLVDEGFALESCCKQGAVRTTCLFEEFGDGDRRGSLLRVDAVLDAVHIFVVVDVENFVQLQAVGIVDTVACAEGVLVVQSKVGEALRHSNCVESFDSEHNWETLEC